MALPEIAVLIQKLNNGLGLNEQALNWVLLALSIIHLVGNVIIRSMTNEPVGNPSSKVVYVTREDVAAFISHDDIHRNDPL